MENRGDEAGDARRPRVPEDDAACTAPVHTRIKADMTCLSVAAAPIVVEPVNTQIVAQIFEESVLGRFFTSGSTLSDLFGIAVKIAQMG